MKKLSLDSVTLCICETRHHELARLAVEDSIRNIDFCEILICSDRELAITEPYRFEKIPDFASQEEFGLWMVLELPKLLKTPFMLQIQYDSWIISPRMWRNDFLNYDYIGPPWGWHQDGFNVGCGGFMLISQALALFISENNKLIPVTMPTDSIICRENRLSYERAGFRWAPSDVALDFGFERTGFRGTHFHFGFHGIFNWSLVLDSRGLAERISLCAEYHNQKGLKEIFDAFGQYLTSSIISESKNFKY